MRYESVYVSTFVKTWLVHYKLKMCPYPKQLDLKYSSWKLFSIKPTTLQYIEEFYWKPRLI